MVAPFPPKGLKQYYNRLKAHTSISIDPNTGQLRTAAVATKVAEAIAAEPTVVTAAETAVDTALVGSGKVADAVGEWWIHPLATYQDQPYPRTVFGAIAADGTVLACEMNHATLRVKRYPIGTASIDDHNVPAIYVEHGRRTVAAWTNHLDDNFIRLRVGSRRGDLGSLVDAPAQDVDIAGLASYTQIHKIAHLSDDDQDTFYIFTRRGLYEWIVQPVTVTQATGVAAFGTRKAFVRGSGTTVQIYCTTGDAFNASGNQVIRVAMGFNPAQPLKAIYYFEIDVVTGAVTDPVNGGTSWTLGTAFVPESVATPVVAEPSVGNSRRLFYVRPGPDAPAIAYADWTIGDENTATYKVLDLAPLDPNYLDVGSGTGYATAAYHADMVHADGYVYTVALKTPTSAQSTELGRRYSDGTSGFYFRLDSTAKLSFRVIRGSSAQTNNTSTSTVPFNWGDVVGFRLRVDNVANTVERFYSLNPLDETPTWTELDSDVALATDAVNGTNDLIVPTNQSANDGATRVYWATLATITGTLLAGVDFRTEWQAGESPFTDDAGRSWTLASGASIVIHTRPTYELGVSGARIGYTADANYIAGIAFEYPSYDRAIVRCRTDGTTETVDKLRLTEGSYAVEVLTTQASTAGRLVRPYPPVGGGPHATLVTEITSYAGFDAYTGNVRGVS